MGAPVVFSDHGGSLWLKTCDAQVPMEVGESLVKSWRVGGKEMTMLEISKACSLSGMDLAYDTYTFEATKRYTFKDWWR